MTSTLPVAPEKPASAPPATELEDLVLDQNTGFNLLLGLWQKTAKLAANGEPCQAVTAQGLRCHQARGTWNNIRRYQRPALLELRLPSGKAYALVTGLRQQTVQLAVGDEEHEAPLSQLEPYWFGDFTLLWRPPPTGDTLINSQSSYASVQWLKQSLALAGYVDEDWPLAQQVQEFQLSQGLKADGIAGPDTLIHLSNSAGSPGIPRLSLEP